MMIAAATMIAQSGEMLASHTPSDEVTAPPRPAATPSLGMQLLLRMCEIAPETDVGMIVKSDVAVLAMARQHADPQADQNGRNCHADDFHAVCTSSSERWVPDE